MSRAGVAREAGAEFLGTFLLVSAGCGAIIVEAQTGLLGHAGVALAFGLVVAAMVAATGHVSGAHLNPAVTLAFAVTRHFSWRKTPYFILAQTAGAVLAAGMLRIVLGTAGDLGVTRPAGPPVQSFMLEILLTAILMFVITAVATDTRAVGQPAAIMIGATVGLNALWAGPVSGASMNPARSLGPALVAGVWQGQWIYLAAPLLGAVIGALAYQWIRSGGRS